MHLEVNLDNVCGKGDCPLAGGCYSFMLPIIKIRFWELSKGIYKKSQVILIELIGLLSWSRSNVCLQ